MITDPFLVASSYSLNLLVSSRAERRSEISKGDSEALLQAVCLLPKSIAYLSQCPSYDLHGEGLPRHCLSVGEDCASVSHHDLLYQGFHHGPLHVQLLALGSEYSRQTGRTWSGWCEAYSSQIPGYFDLGKEQYYE
jgi:hypothetical protein